MTPKAKTAPPLRIVSLTAENMKRLVAVHIEPNGNLVQVTGKNGHGKTSVLDSIWWTLAGKGPIQDHPVRKGQTKGFSELDLGEFIVRRDYEVDPVDGTWTTALTVTAPDGALYSSPQRMLDGFLGSLSFDPLAFMEKDARSQVVELLRVANVDLDVDEIDRLNKGDYERRTQVNRTVRHLTEKVATFAADLRGLGAQDRSDVLGPVDASALLAEMEQASSTNSAIERERVRREGGRLQAANAQTRVERLREEAEGLRRRAAEVDADADRTLADADRLTKELDALPRLDQPVDVAQVRAKVEAANVENAKRQKIRDAIARHDESVAELKTVEAESEALTAAMDARTKSKSDALAAAKMPVDGLSLGEGVVTYNGIPLDQASSAEQLRVSLAIGMSGNATLRVILIKQGSLLDEDSIALVAKMAEENEYQVWMERVDSTGTVGIVMENGQARVAGGA